MSCVSAWSAPPLPAWPLAAHRLEPAYGFFQRVALANGQENVVTFAYACGLNPAVFDPGEFLNFCLELPFSNPEELVSGTPVVGDFVAINGQTLRRRDWSFSQPRVCPGCLREARYYRNWWDLPSLRFCPIHRRRLIDGLGTLRLDWRLPQVGVLPDGADLSRAAPLEAERADMVWEEYVLGRMGVIPATAIPHLDEVALANIIQIASLVGCVSQSSHAEAMKWRELRLAKRPENIPAGFEALRHGLDAVTEHFVRYAGLQGAGAGDRRLVFGVDGLFGGLPTTLNKMSDNPLSSVVIAAMHQAAKRFGIYARKGSMRQPRGPDDPILLNELARELELKPARVREIAVKLGLMRLTRRRTDYHVFSRSAVEQIKETIADFVPRREAAQLAGVSQQELKAVGDEGILQPFVRLGGSTAVFDQYRRMDIEAVLASGVIAAARRARHRMLPPIGSLKPLTGPCSMTSAAAASFLAVDLGTMNSLVLAGRVRGARSEGGRSLLDRYSVEAFGKRFAPARLYAEFLSCRPEQAAERLRARGVQPLSLDGRPNKTLLVNRAEAREALGLTREPDDPRGDATKQFWADLAAHLQEAVSTVRLVRTNAGIAAISYAVNRLHGQLQLTDEALLLKIHGNAKLSPRAYRTLLAMHDRAELAGLQVELTATGVTVAARYCMSLQDHTTWLASFDWVDEWMSDFGRLFGRAMTRVERVRPESAASVAA